MVESMRLSWMPLAIKPPVDGFRILSKLVKELKRLWCRARLQKSFFGHPLEDYQLEKILYPSLVLGILG